MKKERLKATETKLTQTIQEHDNKIRAKEARMMQELEQLLRKPIPVLKKENEVESSLGFFAVEGQIKDLVVYCKYALKCEDNNMIVDSSVSYC